MKIFSLDEIAKMAKVSSYRSDIRWDKLESKRNQKIFLDSLSQTIATLPTLEELYNQAIYELQGIEESDDPMVNEFFYRLADALHEGYVCEYVRDTYLAVQDITGNITPKRRRRKKLPPKE